jgi:hypothetical protein
MSTELTYRLYEQPDIPGILKLWDESTEWGALTAEKWRQWYIDTPYGECMISIAVDKENEVRGQGVSTPTLLWFHGQELKAQKNSAPVLHKAIRAISANHPVVGMYNTLKTAAVSNGYSLTYALPNSALGPFLRRILPSFKLQRLECVGVPLSNWTDSKANGITVQRVPGFGSEYQDLWLESTAQFPIGIAVVRSPSWLRYRYGGKLALEARQADGALLGYAVFEESTGLLLDCLARSPEDLHTLLQLCLGWLAQQRPDLREVKAMRTPFLAPFLDALGFAARDYEFLLGYEVLNPNLPPNSFDLSQWHLMPGD